MANELREMRQRAAKVGDAFLLFEQQQREAADRYAAFLVEVDAAKAAIAAAKRDALIIPPDPNLLFLPAGGRCIGQL